MRNLAGTLAIYSALLVLAIPASADDWIRRSFPELGLEALFPAEPKQLDDIEDNGVKVRMVAGVTADGTLCLASVGIYSEIPSVQEELEASRDNFVSGVEGTLTSSVPTTVTTSDKVLDAMTFDAETSTYKYRALYMVDGLRVYSATGGVPKSSSDESALDRCVQGFRLLP